MAKDKEKLFKGADDKAITFQRAVFIVCNLKRLIKRPAKKDEKQSGKEARKKSDIEDDDQRGVGSGSSSSNRKSRFRDPVRRAFTLPTMLCNSFVPTTAEEILLQQQKQLTDSYGDNNAACAGRHSKTINSGALEQLLVSEKELNYDNNINGAHNNCTHPYSILKGACVSDDEYAFDNNNNSDGRRSACLLDSTKNKTFTTSMINNVNSLACLATPVRGPKVNQNSSSITKANDNKFTASAATSGLNLKQAPFNLQLATSGRSGLAEAQQHSTALGDQMNQVNNNNNNNRSRLLSQGSTSLKLRPSTQQQSYYNSSSFSANSTVSAASIAASVTTIGGEQIYCPVWAFAMAQLDARQGQPKQDQSKSSVGHLIEPPPSNRNYLLASIDLKNQTTPTRDSSLSIKNDKSEETETLLNPNEDEHDESNINTNPRVFVSSSGNASSFEESDYERDNAGEEDYSSCSIPSNNNNNTRNAGDTSNDEDDVEAGVDFEEHNESRPSESLTTANSKTNYFVVGTTTSQLTFKKQHYRRSSNESVDKKGKRDLPIDNNNNPKTTPTGQQQHLRSHNIMKHHHETNNQYHQASPAFNNNTRGANKKLDNKQQINLEANEDSLRMKRFRSAQCLSNNEQSTTNKHQSDYNDDGKDVSLGSSLSSSKNNRDKKSKKELKGNNNNNNNFYYDQKENYFLQMGAGSRTKSQDQKSNQKRTKQEKDKSSHHSLANKNKQSGNKNNDNDDDNNNNNNCSLLAPEDPMILARQRRPSASNQGSVNVDQQALFSAVECNQLERAKAILEDGKVNVNSLNGDKLTCLDIAVMLREVEMVALLQQYGAKESSAYMTREGRANQLYALYTEARRLVEDLSRSLNAISPNCSPGSTSLTNTNNSISNFLGSAQSSFYNNNQNNEQHSFSLLAGNQSNHQANDKSSSSSSGPLMIATGSLLSSALLEEKQRQLQYWKRRLDLFMHMRYEFERLKIPSPPELIVLQVVGENSLGVKIVHSLRSNSVSHLEGPLWQQKHNYCQQLDQEQQQDMINKDYYEACKQQAARSLTSINNLETQRLPPCLQGPKCSHWQIFASSSNLNNSFYYNKNNEAAASVYSPYNNDNCLRTSCSGRAEQDLSKKQKLAVFNQLLEQQLNLLRTQQRLLDIQQLQQQQQYHYYKNANSNNNSSSSSSSANKTAPLLMLAQNNSTDSACERINLLRSNMQSGVVGESNRQGCSKQSLKKSDQDSMNPCPSIAYKLLTSQANSRRQLACSAKLTNNNNNQFNENNFIYLDNNNSSNLLVSDSCDDDYVQNDYHKVIITKYKIEWSFNEQMDPILNSMVVYNSNSYPLECQIDNLLNGHNYYVRVSSGNHKGFSESRQTNPTCLSPSSWRQVDGNKRRKYDEEVYRKFTKLILLNKHILDDYNHQVASPVNQTSLMGGIKLPCSSMASASTMNSINNFYLNSHNKSSLINMLLLDATMPAGSDIKQAYRMMNDPSLSGKKEQQQLLQEQQQSSSSSQTTTSMRKNLKNFFQSNSFKFHKLNNQNKRGLYLATVIYNLSSTSSNSIISSNQNNNNNNTSNSNDKIVVTNDDRLPIIEVLNDQISPGALMSDFYWLLKINGTQWMDIKRLRQQLQKSHSSSTLHIRIKLLSAIEQMQLALNMEDIGRLFYKPIQAHDGSIIICTCKRVSNTKLVSNLSIKWTQQYKIIPRHLRKISDSISFNSQQQQQQQSSLFVHNKESHHSSFSSSTVCASPSSQARKRADSRAPDSTSTGSASATTTASSYSTTILPATTITVPPIVNSSSSMESQTSSVGASLTTPSVVNSGNQMVQPGDHFSNLQVDLSASSAFTMAGNINSSSSSSMAASGLTRLRHHSDMYKLCEFCQYALVQRRSTMASGSSSSSLTSSNDSQWSLLMLAGNNQPSQLKCTCNSSGGGAATGSFNTNQQLQASNLFLSSSSTTTNPSITSNNFLGAGSCSNPGSQRNSAGSIRSGSMMSATTLSQPQHHHFPSTSSSITCSGGGVGGSRHSQHTYFSAAQKSSNYLMLASLSLYDLLLFSLNEIINFDRTSTIPLNRGLYIGFVQLQTTVESMRLLVPRSRPNMVPCARVRDNAHVSKEEWQLLKKFASIAPNQTANQQQQQSSSSINKIPPPTAGQQNQISTSIATSTNSLSSTSQHSVLPAGIPSSSKAASAYYNDAHSKGHNTDNDNNDINNQLARASEPSIWSLESTGSSTKNKKGSLPKLEDSNQIGGAHYGSPSRVSKPEMSKFCSQLRVSEVAKSDNKNESNQSNDENDAGCERNRAKSVSPGLIMNLNNRSRELSNIKPEMRNLNQINNKEPFNRRLCKNDDRSSSSSSFSCGNNNGFNSNINLSNSTSQLLMSNKTTRNDNDDLNKQKNKQHDQQQQHQSDSDLQKASNNNANDKMALKIRNSIPTTSKKTTKSQLVTRDIVNDNDYDATYNDDYNGDHVATSGSASASSSTNNINNNAEVDSISSTNNATCENQKKSIQSKTINVDMGLSPYDSKNVEDDNKTNVVLKQPQQAPTIKHTRSPTTSSRLTINSLSMQSPEETFVRLVGSACRRLLNELKSQLPKYYDDVSGEMVSILQSLNDDENNRIYHLELIELNSQVTFILLIPSAENVCPVTSYEKSNILGDNKEYMLLPLQIFETIHISTYEPELLGKYSRLSAILETDLIVAQHDHRQAFSSNELKTTKSRVSQLQDMVSVADEFWRQLRWIVDVVSFARDKSVSSSSSTASGSSALAAAAAGASTNLSSNSATTNTAGGIKLGTIWRYFELSPSVSYDHSINNLLSGTINNNNFNSSIKSLPQKSGPRQQEQRNSYQVKRTTSARARDEQSALEMTITNEKSTCLSIIDSVPEIHLSKYTGNSTGRITNNTSNNLNAIDCDAITTKGSSVNVVVASQRQGQTNGETTTRRHSGDGADARRPIKIVDKTALDFIDKEDCYNKPHEDDYSNSSCRPEMEFEQEAEDQYDTLSRNEDEAAIYAYHLTLKDATKTVSKRKSSQQSIRPIIGGEIVQNIMSPPSTTYCDINDTLESIAQQQKINETTDGFFSNNSEQDRLLKEEEQKDCSKIDISEPKTDDDGEDDSKVIKDFCVHVQGRHSAGIIYVPKEWTSPRTSLQAGQKTTSTTATAKTFETSEFIPEREGTSKENDEKVQCNDKKNSQHSNLPKKTKGHLKTTNPFLTDSFES